MVIKGPQLNASLGAVKNESEHIYIMAYYVVSESKAHYRLVDCEILMSA